MQKTHTKTRKIAVTALFAAAILIVTTFARVPIPSTSEYINLGDAVIFAAAALLGGPLGAAAAAVGSALADLFVGAVIYAPATAVIKAAMAFVAAAIIKRDGASLTRYVLASAIAGAVMVAGYFAYGAMLFDLPYAFSTVWFNCIQWGGNVVVSVALFGAVKRVRGVV